MFAMGACSDLAGVLNLLLTRSSIGFHFHVATMLDESFIMRLGHGTFLAL